MKWYLIPSFDNPNKLVKVGTNDSPPPNSILIPEHLKDEDESVLVVSSQEIEGQLIYSVSLDEEKKAQLEAEKLAQENHYQNQRQKHYPSTEALIVALWERVMESRSESSEELENLRQEIKRLYPK